METENGDDNYNRREDDFSDEKKQDLPLHSNQIKAESFDRD